MDINTVTIVGRLTKDTELKKTQGGTSVCSFTVAVGRRGQQENQVDFIPCVAWQQSAEYVAKYGHKGQHVGVVGRIQSRTYEERDGKKRSVVEVHARTVQLLNDGGSKQVEQPIMPTYGQEFDTGTPMNIESDDLPF